MNHLISFAVVEIDYTHYTTSARAYDHYQAYIDAGFAHVEETPDHHFAVVFDKPEILQ
jgi:hypothetical protein